MSKKELRDRILREIRGNRAKAPAEIVEMVARRNAKMRSSASVLLRELISSGDVVLNAKWKLSTRSARE